MKKMCECRSRGCRSSVPMLHADYVRLTEIGQRVVAAGHVDSTRDRVVRVVLNGKGVVVESKRVKPRVRKPQPKLVRASRPLVPKKGWTKAEILANLPASFTEPREMYAELLDEYTVEQMARIVNGL